MPSPSSPAPRTLPGSTTKGGASGVEAEGSLEAMEGLWHPVEREGALGCERRALSPLAGHLAWHLRCGAGAGDRGHH